MELSSDLVSQFVKITNDTKTEEAEVVVYGTVVSDGDRYYVQVDGSSELTPITTTVELTVGDRVIVTIKNHSATVTGNTTDPAIGSKTADGLRSNITQTAAELRSEFTDDINNVNSLISQTASEIRSEVDDVNNDLSSKITQNTDKIATVVENQDEFSKFQQTVEGFSFMGKGGTVKINGGDITLTGAIKFSDLSDSDDVQADIDSAKSTASTANAVANNANATAANANSNASTALTAVNGITITDLYGNTYVDGSMIYSNSIYAGSLHLGGQMTVYQSFTGSTVGGYLGYCTGWNSSTGIGVMHTASTGQCICTDKAARLSFGGDSQIYAGDSTVVLDGATFNIFRVNGAGWAYIGEGVFGAYSGRSIDIGTSAIPWNSIYANTCTGSTSDRNKKNSIEDLPEKYIVMFDNLQPKRFKLNNGTSGRYHVGYIAQEVEEAMKTAGIDGQEFGGFIKDTDEDGNDIYLLRYGEFDGVRDAKIKQLEARVAEQDEKIEQLEARLAALEKLLTS